MRTGISRLAVLLGFSLSLLAGAQAGPQSGGDFSNNPQPKKLPAETILVKGAWSSASDSVTPLPEGGRVTNNVYTNSYFGLAYSLSPNWTEKYSGPPPSDSGYYVLAQIRPSDTYKGTSPGSILVAAQDLFFTDASVTNALEFTNYVSEGLNADFKVEQIPTIVRIGNHSLVRFDYGSPVAELHWHILTTQIRCHSIEFVFTGRDTKLLEELVQGMDKLTLPEEAGPISGRGGGDVPECIKNYASDQNVLERVDPLFTERRFNPVPVRVIIGKDGKIKHIHFLSAFPEQAKAITDALFQWQFKPFLRDGKPAEVETGIMFGRAPRKLPSASAVAE